MKRNISMLIAVILMISCVSYSAAAADASDSISTTSLTIDDTVTQLTLFNAYQFDDNGFAYHDRGFVRLNPGMNTINVLEQNSSGEWSARSTLSLTFIEIDYKPRIL